MISSKGSERSRILGRFHSILFLGLCFLGGTLSCAPVILAGPAFTTIDVPGATATLATGINAAGQIVGSYVDTFHRGHGFMLAGSKFTTVDPPGAISTSATGINDAGQIVGEYFGADTHGTVGFMLAAGRYTTIEVPGLGAGATHAIGINAAGSIVGYCPDATVTRRLGFVVISGRYITFDVPGATETSARGINAADKIVGDYVDAKGKHGFVAAGVTPWVMLERALDESRPVMKAEIEPVGPSHSLVQATERGKCELISGSAPRPTSTNMISQAT